MKTLALITEKNDTASAQWQFDKVMSVITFDVNLSVIFMFDGITQLQYNKAWKCLEIYGIESVFVYEKSDNPTEEYILDIPIINNVSLKSLIKQSDLII